jgi:hypothetical protein
MRFRTYAALVAALPALAACVSHGGAGGTPAPDQRLITRAELDQLGARNAYEAVERLRPRWLQARSGPRGFETGTEIAVFQDQMYLGGLDDLEHLGTEGIFQIKYLDMATAKATLPELGSRYVQGAIVVYMRRPAPQDGRSR